ncbi:MAG: hypothetical protein R2752_03385 [Vicinamibacterales bacterium]
MQKMVEVKPDPQKTDVLNGDLVIHTFCSGVSIPLPASSSCDSLSGSVTVTEGNGSPAPATGATIVSDNTQVLTATIEQSAAFTLRAATAGLASVTATYQGQSASIRTRVLPHYAGHYTGEEEVMSCTATGDFEILFGCSSSTFPKVGDRLAHDVEISQTLDQGVCTLDLGGGSSLTTPGTIAVDGGLFCPGPASTTLPNGLQFEASAYSARHADKEHLDGSYTTTITAPGLSGSIRFESRLDRLERDVPPAATDSRAADPARRGPEHHPR